MVSRYKYYANLLEGYVNTSAIVPLSQNIPTTVLEYHRKTEPNLINFDKQNFLDPYQENHLIEQPSSEAVYMQFTGSLAKPDDDTPDLKSFRMVSQNHKSIIKEEDLEKPFPVTFTASENWWEYEDFRGFPPYMDHYKVRMNKWHKHILSAKTEIQLYDPLWSISPKDPNTDFYMYHYSTTLRVFRPWKYNLATSVLYQRSRLWIYCVFGLFVLSIHSMSYTWKRKKWSRIWCNEDWWITEYWQLYKTLNPNSSASGAEPPEFIINGVRAFTGSIIAFLYGPDLVENIKAAGKEMRVRTLEDHYAMIDKLAEDLPLY